jgi:hypothetical protein
MENERVTPEFGEGKEEKNLPPNSGRYSGGGKGGGAYRWRDSSGEASKEVGEVKEVASRYGSALEVVGAGRSTCGGGGVRWRREIQPELDEIVQLVGLGVLTM